MDFQQMAGEADQDKVWKKGEVEGIFQNLERNGENMNFLRAEANKYGVDYDNPIDPPDQFNRNNNEE